MADVTINGLAAYTTPVAGDFIGVWDVALGQYKKSTRAQLVGVTVTGGGTIALGGFTLTVPASGTAALVANANNFSVEQNVNAPIFLNGTTTTRGSGSASINVGTSATTITIFRGNAHAMLVMVWGSDGASSFVDLVLVMQYWGSTVIASRTVSAPATRTYTTPGGDVLQLAMGAGVWGVRSHVISNIMTN